MTIRFPEPSIFDRLLKLIGKKRGVRIPIGASEKYGSHFYAKAYKESFWKALLRSNNQALPEGLVDVFLISDIHKDTMDD